MRVMTSVVFGCLLAMSFGNGVLAQEPARAVKDSAELSETVKRVFSEDRCAQISENSRRTDEARRLAMTFRFRCEGELADVSVLVNALKNDQGLTVQDVMKYPAINPENDHPAVDVRFDVVARAGG